MNLICKLALLVVPINLIAVSIIRLELLSRSTSETIRNSFDNNTLLVIAHPDDETMFFGPLIMSLFEADKHLTILCLSHGNSHNLGNQRVKEMNKVIHELGPNARLKILTDKRLPDGLSAEWDVDVASRHIEQQLKSSLDSKPTVVSFDSYGISGHPNHQAIYNALKSLRKRSKYLLGKVYYLESVNIIRKYISFFDALLYYLPKIALVSRPTGEQQSITIALNFKQSRRLRKLLALHDSQMVWFRHLYSVFSRYMFINDFRVAS